MLKKISLIILLGATAVVLGLYYDINNAPRISAEITPSPTPTPASPPVVLNSDSSPVVSTAQQTLILSNVTSGSTIIVGVSQSSSANRTYSVTDSQGNAYLSVVSVSNGRISQIFYAKNVVGSP